MKRNPNQCSCTVLKNIQGNKYQNILRLITSLNIICRLTPLILFSTAFLLLLPLVLPHGPLTNDFVNVQVEKCQNYGLLNLFFIQNFISPSKIVMIKVIKTYLINFHFILVSVTHLDILC